MGERLRAEEGMLTAVRSAVRSLLVNPFWNAEERRPRALFRILLALLVLGVLAFGLPRLPSPLRWAFTEAFEAQEHNIEATFAMGSLHLLSSIVVIVALWLASRFVDRRSFDELGLRIDSRWWADAAFGVVLGGALMSGILGVEMAFGWAYYGEPAELGDVPRIAYAPIAAFAFLSVAINEELVSRGNHLKNLAEGLSSRWIPPRSAAVAAVMFSSVVFGLAHVGNPSASVVSTGNIVLAGLMLAVGYLLTGRLGIAIGLHFSWNFFQNLYGMPVSGGTRFFTSALILRDEAGPDWITGGSFGPEAGITGLCAMFVGTLATIAWVRLRYGRLAIDPSIAARPPLVRAGLPRGSRAIEEHA